MSSSDEEPPKKKPKRSDELPVCPYGADCYRKNPQHFKEFSHPKKGDKTPALACSSTDTSSLPPCKYGVNCYRKNLLHFAEYWHPFQDNAVDNSEPTEPHEDSEGDTDTDIQHLEEEEDTKPKAVKSKTDFLRRGKSLIKSFTKMTEEERKELIKQAFEAKQHLQDKLKESEDKIKKQTEELERLQHRVNTGTLLMEGEEKVLAGTEMETYTLFAERTYEEGSAAQVHFRLAESQFYRLVSGTTEGYRVNKVEYIVTPELVKRFKEARANLKKLRGKERSLPVLAFHGTEEANIVPICKTGFRVPGESGFAHRTDTGYYGMGVYFSEYPTYSMDYIEGGTKLLLCQVLLGKVFQCTQLIHGNPLKSGYDSHTSPDKKELVIFNSHHILPCYIVYYQTTTGEFKYAEKAKTKPRKTKGQLTEAYWKASKIEKSGVFAGRSYVLLGKLAETHENIKKLIVKHGGECKNKSAVSSLIPVIASEEILDTPAFGPFIAKAKHRNITVLREDYIYNCVIKKKLLAHGSYALT